jgi:large subunit ribosomal protein L4
VEVPVYNIKGEQIKNIDISDTVFGVPFNQAVVHQAMVRQRANGRQGTHDTKTRGEVAGSRKKMFAQKHTGEARAGDRRSPTRQGGGVTFGPHPRDYSKNMPKKMRRLALRCMLSSKVSEGSLRVLDSITFDAPKTKEVVDALKSLNLDKSALIVTADPETNVVKSARNIPGVKTLTANILNVVDLLSYQNLVITEEAVRKAEELWGERLSQEENSAAL